MKYPESLGNLIHHFKMLPGIGEKTAERMAFSLVSFDPETIQLFSQAMLDVKEKLKRCATCNNISDTDFCSICTDETRKKNVICVVSDPKNIYLFEKSGIFNGQYQVLDGVISLSNGIGPNDIKINLLVDRIAKEKIEEVIVAVKPSVDGEATALYIAKKLEPMGVLVSKIAQGVPLGADIDYIDSMTLEAALYNRNKIS